MKKYAGKILSLQANGVSCDFKVEVKAQIAWIIGKLFVKNIF